MTDQSKNPQNESLADSELSELAPGAELQQHSVDAAPIALGAVGWVRWMWRQLITMRTALQLLFLLAVASIPGSVFPQRTQSPLKVRQYFDENPTTAPILDRIGMFDVYGSSWFSAIYILLMISLVGCIIPRARVHWKSSRSLPPVAPRNLLRLRHSSTIQVSNTPSEVSQEFFPILQKYLATKRWRTVVSELDANDPTSGYVSAERGYLRETGNLIFHLAIVVILISVAAGSLFGYRGQILVREGTSITNVLSQYDAFTPGRLFNTESLVPFNITLTDLAVTYEDTGIKAGTALDYAATISYRETPDSPLEKRTIGVNDPLNIGNSSMFLVGHGYAPRFEVRDAKGNLVFDDAVIFLPQDSNMTSTGVVKVADTDPQLGLQIIFAPTAVVTEQQGPHSLFPDLIDPKAFMSAWIGDLGLDTGRPQNVYTLDKTNLKRIGFEEIAVGETWDLPKNAGSVKLVGVDQFATFNIASDPAQNWALVGAILAIVGVIAGLYIQRRRMWVRVVTRDGQTWIEIAAMSRYEDVDVSSVVESITQFCASHFGVEKFAEVTNEEKSH